MINRLFPKQFDNQYRGSVAAIVILIPLILFKLAIGVNVSGLNPFVSARQVLTSVDGVPLDSFSPEAAAEVLFSVGAWGVAMVCLGLLGIIALIRYRSMIPLIFVLLAVEQVGRKVVGTINFPPDPAGAVGMGAIINWGFLALLALGLSLSLIARKSKPAALSQ